MKLLRRFLHELFWYLKSQGENALPLAFFADGHTKPLGNTLDKLLSRCTTTSSNDKLQPTITDS